MMKKALMMAALVVASLATANQADAAFVLIDNFYGPGTGSGAGVTGTVANRSVFGGATTVSGGAVTVENGSTLSYTNLAALISPTGLNGTDDLIVRLNGISGSGTLTATASIDGFDSFIGKPLLGAPGFLEFTFAGVDPGAFAGTLDLVFGSAFGVPQGGSYTINGIYAVPEPTTMALIGLAVVGGGAVRLRRKRQLA
ncbi:PEP-CTERM sorting domain-containing protein [Rubripirellula lacrimiformis]|nr:PEP-CTERM sorting domain-containing protein [Rubripirellula lacrimiformis]